jgi:hypothetical protein
MNLAEMFTSEPKRMVLDATTWAKERIEQELEFGACPGPGISTLHGPDRLMLRFLKYDGIIWRIEDTKRPENGGTIYHLSEATNQDRTYMAEYINKRR